MDSSLPEMSKVDTLKADIKEQHRKDILPVSVESYSSAEEELKEIQRVSEMAIKETATKLLPVRAPDSVKQYHEDSSESEPSPQIQRRRVRPASSSSEDYKLDSSNSGDDEEFIRRQLMHMGEDENLPSDEEKHREEQQTQQETREVEKSDDSMKPKRALKKLTVQPEEISDITLSSHDQDDQVAQVIPVSEALEEIRVEIDLSNDNEKIIATDTTAVAITQKTPVRRQRRRMRVWLKTCPRVMGHPVFRCLASHQEQLHLLLCPLLMRTVIVAQVIKKQERRVNSKERQNTDLMARPFPL